jgi:hypothetical protein
MISNTSGKDAKQKPDIQLMLDTNSQARLKAVGGGQDDRWNNGLLLTMSDHRSRDGGSIAELGFRLSAGGRKAGAGG